MHNIKQLKPSKSKRYKQGYINPLSCKKLYESQQNKPIIYRSSWEKKFMYWCERCDSVLHWGSECVGIPYISLIDNKQHTYFPDFVIEMKDGRKMLIEIKPYNQTIPPGNFNSYAGREFLRNQSKWKTVREQCEKNGYEFHILTEKTINKI